MAFLNKDGLEYFYGKIKDKIDAVDVVPDLTMGSVTTLDSNQSASATITGTKTDPVLNLSIPRGSTPSISIGTISTVEYDEGATATITGTDANPVLNLEIPRGIQGVNYKPYLDENDIINWADAGDIPNNIADVYSSSNTYSISDCCTYQNQLYKCKTNISVPESWDATHWESINIIDLLNEDYNKVACEKLVLPETTIDTWVGTPYQLQTPTLSPSDTTEKVRYKSYDTDVLNIDSTGLVTSTNYGNTAIDVMCGDQTQTVRANVSIELPKTVGVIGYLSASTYITDSNVMYIWVGSNNTHVYTLPFLDYPIKPGQTLHITNDAQYYRFHNYRLVKGDISLSYSSGGNYNYSNVELVEDLGGYYGNLTYEYTNNLTENVYLMALIQFIDDEENSRTDEKEAITEAQLQSFWERDSMKFWITPDPDGEITTN